MFYKEKLIIPIFLFLYSLILRLIILAISNPLIDDFFITLRVAKNFINGNGLVYNVGEKIISSTSNIYSIFCAVFLFFFNDNAILIIRIVLSIFDALTAVLIFQIIRKSLNKYSKLNFNERYKLFLSILGALIYSSFSTVVSSNLRGLETAIYIFFIVLCVYWFESKMYSLSFLSACISTIIRPDGFILVFAFLISFFLYKINWKNLIYGFIVVSLYYLLTYLNFGEIVPQSVVAKSFVQRDFTTQWSFFISKFILSEKAFILGILFISGLYFCIKNRFLILLNLWGFFYVFLFSTIGVWWPWYIPPFIFYYSIMIVLGFINILALVKNRIFQIVVVVFFSMIPILLLFQSFQQEFIKFKDRSRIEIAFKKDLATYLNRVSQPNDIISLEPLGIIGYYCFERKFIDYPGLVSKQATDLWKSSSIKILGNLTDTTACKIFLKNIKPDFIILRKSELEANHNNNELFSYLVIKEFNMPAEFKSMNPEYADLIILKRAK